MLWIFVVVCLPPRCIFSLGNLPWVKLSLNAKAERSTADNISIGDRVEIIWDRHRRYGTSKKGMPKTDMEGTIGTVEKVSECCVWVKVDGHKELKQKRKHNVKRLGHI